ncbi:MAG: hypothetical protein CFE35_14885 [Novosphingobium sp. PASSN1]|nr:MAG: hypothetical protein CFE35_14885 [Novosphingobium sp. PASSN1]
MKRPKKPFRPDRDTGVADGLIVGRTAAKAQREDGNRLKALRDAHIHCPELTAQAMDLHDRMARAIAAGEVPDTLASAECWREGALPTVGHLWKGVDEYGPENVSLVTLRPQGMLWEGDDLLDVDPRRLKARLRNHLDRAGVTAASGFLFMGLDLEFDANRGRSGVWDGHWHGIVGGDKIEALEALRERRAYKNARVHPLEQGMTIQPRVHIVKGLVNLPHPICYCLKGWACHRPTFPNEEGLLERSKRKGRVPTPYLIRWLLWMDQWKLDDLVLRNSLKITRNGFAISPVR